MHKAFVLLVGVLVCAEHLCTRCLGSVSAQPADATGAGDSVMLSIQLSTSVNDVEHDFGLIQNKVNPFEKDAVYQAPPSSEWTTGAMNLGMYRSLQNPGEYVAYVGNTTGNIPLGGVQSTGSNLDDPKQMCLRRWVTTDFVKWSGGQCVHMYDETGMGAIKTMARDDRTGKLFALVYASKNASLYTSVNDGKTFTGPTYPQGLLWRGPDSAGHMMYAKDDLNFVWTQAHGLVDFAIFWEKPVRFPVDDMCDNGGWNQGGTGSQPSKPQRRIIGTIEATDSSGMNWTSCGLYLQPDPNTDPPELQFYRIRPSLIPGTESTRVWAHILQVSQILELLLPRSTFNGMA
jgi:hypothetical protein